MEAICVESLSRVANSDGSQDFPIGHISQPVQELDEAIEAANTMATF
jgi:hypothetical protein